MQITPKNYKHLISEVYIQKTSNHPNIVEYIDGYRVDETIWAVLEYMGGGSLTNVLEQNIQLKENHIAFVCLEVFIFILLFIIEIFCYFKKFILKKLFIIIIYYN